MPRKISWKALAIRDGIDGMAGEFFNVDLFGRAYYRDGRDYTKRERIRNTITEKLTINIPTPGEMHQGNGASVTSHS